MAKKTNTKGARSALVAAALAYDVALDVDEMTEFRALSSLHAACRDYRAAVAAKPAGGLDAADYAMLRAARRYPLNPRKNGPNMERAQALQARGLLKTNRWHGFKPSAKGLAKLKDHDAKRAAKVPS